MIILLGGRILVFFFIKECNVIVGNCLGSLIKCWLSIKLMSFILLNVYYCYRKLYEFYFLGLDNLIKILLGGKDESESV